MMITTGMCQITEISIADIVFVGVLFFLRQEKNNLNLLGSLSQVCQVVHVLESVILIYVFA